MLVGRDRECEALDRLLSEARVAHSGVLALVGEPGIGKTALLEYAVEHSEGIRVLQVRGIESESVVPFGGLLQLLRPGLGLLDRIPTPQADALAAALALQPSSTHGRFAVGAATLSLLATYAEDGRSLWSWTTYTGSTNPAPRRCSSRFVDWWRTRSRSFSPFVMMNHHCSIVPIFQH